MGLIGTKVPAKYLLIFSSLGMKNPKDPKPCKKPQTAEQWKLAWKSRGSRDLDAMDTTPGRTRARKIDTDERTELMKAGKCFTCKKQRHLSCDCHEMTACGLTQLESSDTLGIERGIVLSA